MVRYWNGGNESFGMFDDEPRQARTHDMDVTSTLIRATPARCKANGPLTTDCLEPWQRRSRDDSQRFAGYTRCVLHRYHTGACSFSILGVGREGVE